MIYYLLYTVLLAQTKVCMHSGEGCRFVR